MIRSKFGITVATLCSVLLAPCVRAQQKTDVAEGADSRAVLVQLNGRRLADAIAVKGARSDEVLVPVISLARALDGPPATVGQLKRQPRLRLDGRKLIAVAPGGCNQCPSRVTR
jgi:hypothetical protein